MFRPFFTEGNVRLVFEEDEPLPAMVSDEEKIAQILRNFLSNALKFTEQGEVRVRARYSAPEDSIVFSVQDTGIGISPEHYRHIFEEFAQIENPLQRRSKGTGLGLPLCKKLAELLEGQVRVESQLGAGSTFTAVVPRAYGRGVTEPGGVSRPAVLMIDDQEISRYLLRQLLGGQYQLLEASSGEEGLEQVRKIKPDAIFLDLNMPGLDGFEVLARLGSEGATRDIPVVIVTEQTLDEAARARLDGRVAGFFAKATLSHAEALTLDFGPPLSVSVRYAQGDAV